MQALEDVQAELITVAASSALLTVGIIDASQAYSEFATHMAQVQTIAKLSDDSLAALSDEARKTGLEVNRSGAEIADGMYEMLSAGVAVQETAGAVKLATEAAVGGVSDTKTAATVGIAVINAYGRTIGELGSVYDTLFATVRDGVVTFPELAAGIGDVLPIAKSAGVSFETLAALIAQLTKNGVPAAEAMTAVKGGITALVAPAPEAKKRFDELGISTGDFIKTLSELDRIKPSIALMRELVPDTEARTAILSLTDSFSDLQKEIAVIGDSAGEAKKAYAIMADTPAEKMKKFEAAITDIKVAAGQLAAQGLPLIEVLTAMLNGFNALPDSSKNIVLGMTGVVAIGGTAATAFYALRNPIALLVADVTALNARFVLSRVAAATMVTSISSVASVSGITALAVGGLNGALNLLKAHPLIAVASLAVAAGYAVNELLNKQDAAQEKISAGITEAAKTTHTLFEMQSAIFAAGGQDAQKYVSELANISRQYQAGEIDKDAAIAKGRAYTDQVIALLKAQGEAEFTVAESTKALTAEVLNTKLNAANAAFKNTEEKLNAALKDEKQYAEQVARLTAERVNAQAGTQDKIRTLRQKEMSEAEKQADVQKQIDEKLKASTALVEEGSTKSLKAAQGLGEEIQRLAEGMKDTDKAVANVQKGGDLIDQVKAKEIEIAEQAQQKQKSAAEQFRAEQDGNIKKIQELQTELGKIDPTKTVKLNADIAEAKTNLANIRAQLDGIQSKTITVTVNKQGGEVVSAGSNSILKDSTLFKAGGGYVQGAGTGTSDSINARLSNGEYVLQAAAVQALGVNFLDGLNGMKPGGINIGNVVSAGVGAASAANIAANSAPGQRGVTIQHLVIQGVQDARALLRELEQLTRTEPAKLHIAGMSRPG